MNYERIGSPFPFFSNWNHEIKDKIKYTDLLLIQIKCLRRCPEPLAYLCIAEEEDLQNPKIHYKEPLHNRIKLNSKISIDDIENLAQLQTSRKIIGFITSGGFSFSKCKGYGLGYIFLNYQGLIGKKILFRNPTSQFYHICSLSLIKNN